MERKAPQRTCIGCRRKRDQDQLIRIGRDSHGEIVPSATRGQGGRGAYVCPDPECVEAALKRGRLDHALKCRIDPDVKENLGRALLRRFEPSVAGAERPHNTTHAN